MKDAVGRDSIIIEGCSYRYCSVMPVGFPRISTACRYSSKAQNNDKAG